MSARVWMSRLDSQTINTQALARYSCCSPSLCASSQRAAWCSSTAAWQARLVFKLTSPLLLLLLSDEGEAAGAPAVDAMAV